MGGKHPEHLEQLKVGAKGLCKAVKEVFGGLALVQRCQWRKRENVVSYLSKDKQNIFRQKLQRAYDKPDYKEAKSALEHVGKERYQDIKRGFPEACRRAGIMDCTFHDLRRTFA